jgi:hypothetical protein
MVPVRRGFRRLVLVPLVALPLLLTTGSDSAEASCTYNLGSGSDHGFSFRSHWGDIGGYGAWDMKAGQSQCWYDHGWDSGWFGPPDCWLNCSFWPSLIDVDAHGWIDICAYATSDGPQWAYRAYDSGGTPSAYGQSDYGYPPGCTGALGSAGASSARARESTGRSPRGSGPRRKARANSVFFTGRARSRRVRSITFHVHGEGGKALGSVCMAPLDVSRVDLEPARRMKIESVYVGIVEHPRACGHPKVAGRERAERPRSDDRYASFCQETRTRVERTYRYPDDFERSTRPDCDAEAG